ncbi:MAG: MATE family efflux transporter [Lachnospiraceae bacterium]|nr:MATE family efflux transporter [Lachnospiraceae bacterium]
MKSKLTISKKDENFREFALNGNLWMLLLQVGLPLALYQNLNMVFKILDSMMASHISAESVSAVAYLSQINHMISAVGGGLAIGSSLQISKAYGAGDYKLVRKRVSSLFGICGVLGIILLCLIPFTPAMLRFAKTPENLIAIGSRYFSIELLGLVVGFINNVYIAIERSRGNSQRILYLNLFVIIFKLGLTAFFVYVLESDITMIAVATLVSQFILLGAGIYNMTRKESAFSFSFKNISFRWNTIGPMLHISFPVMVEKSAFSFGKVIVNSMSSMYGSLTVGALGISNNINGFTTSAQNGFQEGCAAIISQNLGAGNKKRAMEAFKKVLCINVTIGIIGFILTSILIHPISKIYATSGGVLNTEFQEMIIAINYYDIIGGCVPLGIFSSCMAFLFGYGKTRLTLLLNFCRVFVFRIPVLWALQNFTQLGSESVGITMMVSNILVAVMAIVVVSIVAAKECKKDGIKFFGKE